MFFRKNDVHVPDTPETPPPVPLSMRMAHWVYTLSDDWYIREDVYVENTNFDYVLLSRYGIYAVYMQPLMGYVVAQGMGLKVNGEPQDHLIRLIRSRNVFLERTLKVRVTPVAMFDNSDIRGFDLGGVKIANPELLVNYLEALQVVSIPLKSLNALNKAIKAAQQTNPSDVTS
ncbi:hypothetical protein [Deinococcus cellulosilyticus]|uniref:Uncharacterized protein n=1 Tax=Deinococcus cellulosilyticus (strain DSM 18568 / NBRC 106333 / KACC 11606 / 5516J-15) TaxID=1223518 RepID=A0A511N3H3_DEIC1|nr:hypothetical protein [Deinococcus cellulosilyticus]GEM46998.1 hypothetical protein DC3_26330 [Deinococcus cellulosilyticus NBRC 106333 = KACC 11606]